MKYRTEIDGLRAIAIIPVILYHADFKSFQGGYVGVDIFFVISGYLITQIIIKDLKTNSFSLFNFYARRCLKILPPLYTVIFISTILAYIILTPGQMKEFSQSLVAINLFLSNIFFYREFSYFRPDILETPLIATWSLSIEEQFYILFPLFMYFCGKFLNKNNLKIAIILLILSSVSLVYAEYLSIINPQLNFYSLQTRVWELLAGSLTALIYNKLSFKYNNLFSILGLLLIFFSIFFFKKNFHHPGFITLVPVIGTILIILFAQKNIVQKFLSSKIFVFTGLISYSLYLFHQPVFAFMRLLFFDLSELHYIICFLLIFLISYCSWKFIEQPFRLNKNKTIKRKNIFIIFILISLFFIGFGLAGHKLDGFKNISESRKYLSQYEERFQVNYGINSICDESELPEESCSNSKSPEILLWGDSLAMHLYDGLLASKPDIKIRQHTLSSCAPVLGMPFNNNIKQTSQKCLNLNSSTYLWLSQNESVDYVILSANFNSIIKNTSIKNYEKIFDENFIKTIKKIKELNKNILIVSPLPTVNFDIKRCFFSNRFNFNNNNCNFILNEDDFSTIYLKKISKYYPVYWLKNDICSNKNCYTQLNDNIIFRDNIHLSREGSFFLGKLNNWYDNFIIKSKN